MIQFNPIVFTCSINENYNNLYKILLVVTFLIGYETNTSNNSNLKNLLSFKYSFLLILLFLLLKYIISRIVEGILKQEYKFNIIESITIYKGLGLQISTKSYFNKTSIKFISFDTIESVFINEYMTSTYVYYNLGVNIKNEKKNTKPDLEILIKVYKDCYRELSIYNELEILHDINLTINKGEVHVLLGQNGSGKSTLLNVLMGLSGYKITKGKIFFMGEDITEMDISDRANLGMGIMFQKAPSIQGLKLKTLVKTAFGKNNDEIDINNASEKSNMKEFLDRDVNVGFSGGEMKRCELFQLNLQDPEFIMLDEPESGVDLENMKLVGDSIRKIIHRSEKTRSALVITHTGHILSYLDASISHIMLNGRIYNCGDATTCLKVIEETGYEECLRRMGEIYSTVDTEVSNEVTTEVSVDHINKKPKKYEDCVYDNNNKTDRMCVCGKYPGKTCFCGMQRCKGCTCGLSKIEKNLDATVITDKNSKVTVNVFDEDLYSPLNDIDSLKSLPEIKTKEVEKVKVSLDDPSLFNGEYKQINNDKANTIGSTDDGIEVIKLAEAMKKYPDFKEKYIWKNIKYDKDDYTKAVYEHEKICYNGYVIIAHEGAKNLKPVKAQLLMEQIPVQYVHNILIAKKGSCLSVSSFCGFCNKKEESDEFNGQHYGISEFYVEEDAQLSFSMIHNYCLNYTIYPRSASRVEKNGIFISSYVCLDPVNKVQMNPTAYLVGENAIARFSSILMCHEGGLLDIGSTAFLQAPGTSSESITRALTKGGTIIASGRIVSESVKSSGHIECQGMVLKKGIIRSIPAIEGGYDCELSHEAAVGKIAQEKVDYLMSRGIKEEDAISIIIRGFLDVRIKGIPPMLQEEIDYVMEEAAHGF